jgi:hypothetical protein
MNDSEKVTLLMDKVKELQFKLEKLQNFVFEHHHNLSHQGLKTDETSKGKVWVEYPTGRKEEPT